VLMGAIQWDCKVMKAVGSVFLPDISEDAKMGLQVSQEIGSKPSEYPLLAERGNEQLYGYVIGITNKIINGGAVEHQKDFGWQVKIINDPKTLNAFCTPGGYIYVYTGLIKYLDSEDQLAGVMAHEIGHADKRHSMIQMYNMYGISLLAGIGTRVATKDTSSSSTAMTIAQITQGLVGLKFSRGHETEADNASVAYLCGSEYNAAGAAGFFEKIGNGGSPPEFLSTHPSPENRVVNIHEQAKLKGCAGTAKNVSQYAQMKALIR
jgi:beta-barrel assembly-enhancing protease